MLFQRHSCHYQPLMGAHEVLFRVSTHVAHPLEGELDGARISRQYLVAFDSEVYRLPRTGRGNAPEGGEQENDEDRERR
ncbi:MAG: hypothetical protein NZ732_02165, partial [Candidatus Poseidoniales archaeon]|nr:hypothetical protein [Candidatus Poseidoniales archaeon]